MYCRSPWVENLHKHIVLEEVVKRTKIVGLAAVQFNHVCSESRIRRKFTRFNIEVEHFFVTVLVADVEIGGININDFRDWAKVVMVIIRLVDRGLVRKGRSRNCFNFFIMVEKEITVICGGVCYCICSTEGLICWFVQYVVDTGTKTNLCMVNRFLNSNGKLIVNKSMADVFNSGIEFPSLGAGDCDGSWCSIKREHGFWVCPGATLLMQALDVDRNKTSNLKSCVMSRFCAQDEVELMFGLEGCVRK